MIQCWYHSNLSISPTDTQIVEKDIDETLFTKTLGINLPDKSRFKNCDSSLVNFLVCYFKKYIKIKRYFRCTNSSVYPNIHYVKYCNVIFSAKITFSCQIRPINKVSNPALSNTIFSLVHLYYWIRIRFRLKIIYVSKKTNQTFNQNALINKNTLY